MDKINLINHYENRIAYLKYRDEVTNKKRQVSNRNLIAKIIRKLNAAKG